MRHRETERDRERHREIERQREREKESCCFVKMNLVSLFLVHISRNRSGVTDMLNTTTKLETHQIMHERLF